MKLTKPFLGFLLIYSINSFSQILEGGKKDYGIFTPNNGDWFFTQKFINNPLNRSYYNNKVYYIDYKMEYDINNDGIKDAGDYALKVNNFSKNSADYILMTAVGGMNYEGTEVEIYTDCTECISFYKNGIQKNIYDMNLFKRYSKIIPTDGKSYRTITSLPLLAQIPNNLNKRKFKIEIGMKIRGANKLSCSSTEYSDYQFFPVNNINDSHPLNSQDSYYLSYLGNCKFGEIKTSEPIKTPLIKWGNEYEIDRFIVVYTLEY